jgi:hypothetical protein
MSEDASEDRGRCECCRYWHRLDTNPGQGECRRHAPSPEAFESIHMMAAWPVSNGDDWCGEFQGNKAESPGRL